MLSGSRHMGLDTKITRWCHYECSLWNGFSVYTYYGDTGLLGTGCCYAAICTEAAVGRRLVRLGIHYTLKGVFMNWGCCTGWDVGSTRFCQVGWGHTEETPPGRQWLQVDLFGQLSCHKIPVLLHLTTKWLITIQYCEGVAMWQQTCLRKQVGLDLFCNPEISENFNHSISTNTK